MEESVDRRIAAGFNLVIEVLLISRMEDSYPSTTAASSFNLVIEVLLISRRYRLLRPPGITQFQSRNRGSFDFKYPFATLETLDLPFQSRNRGSFDFKWGTAKESSAGQFWFQSRNRGSFDFKSSSESRWSSIPARFQSRNRGSFDFKSIKIIATLQIIPDRFNLVIEVLLISRKSERGSQLANGRSFQSRNRGSFDFK